MHVKFIFNFSFVNIIVKFNTSIVSNSFRVAMQTQIFPHAGLNA